MNDCVIKIIIYVIGSSKERLQHIQSYLHRSWCIHNPLSGQKPTVEVFVNYLGYFNITFNITAT